MLFTRDWWNATAVRVVRTAAQTLIAAIGVNFLGWFDNWLQTLALVGTMSLLSFLNAIIAPPPEGK